MPTEHPDLFRALAAPFPKEQERTRNQGGVQLTYITARAVMNRLDEVAGGENWWPHYQETRDGIKCSITIRFPDGREVTKEDGGGFSAMKAEDDTEKSGYSDALKRAGVTWGVGRYLYRDGVPRYDVEPDRREMAKPRPSPPKAPKPEYKEWADGFCDGINAKWAASHPDAKPIINVFQLSKHMLKFLNHDVYKEEGKNLAACGNAWLDLSGVMAEEAVTYCRDKWREAAAKITPAPTPAPAREPGMEG